MHNSIVDCTYKSFKFPMEQYEIEATDFAIFPNEIVMKILSKLDTVVLEKICSRVCHRWKEISEAILQNRLEKIRSTLSESAWKEINVKIPLNSSDLVILKEYERTFISPHLEIHNTRIDSYGFIRRIDKKRACNCDDVDVCITRVIHFMPCHKLILIQLPEQMCYYHETDPYMLHGDNDVEPYITEAPLIRVDNNTHAAVSVYHDRVVVQETTRILMLFQVVKVDHEQRSVTVERIRRIFLPLWSCAVTLCDNKVFALFTTGHLGVWHEDSDALVISDNKCGTAESIKTMRLSMLFRCNELIFIKLLSPSDVSWTIVDAKETVLNLHTVPINSLINSAFSIRGECSQVLQLCVWNNSLIVHCKITDGNVTERKILIGRMKEDPKREHFLSQQRFQDLFHPPSKNQIQPICMNGSITTPFSPQFPEHHHAASFLGIQRIRTEIHHRPRLRLVSIELRN